MGGEHRGVPYALTLGGELADPATAEPLTRGYRCLACGEFVHLKRGKVRVAHFAHYADREVACNPETVLHEAAKLRLRDMLLAGTRAFHLQVACPGYRTAYDTTVKCSGENPAMVTLRAPGFDEAGVEVPFLTYRLDAAATLDGEVVLGLEVYQSHQVDEPKRAALAGSGLPWLEVGARPVLEQDMPWRAVSSSAGEVQCRDCRAEAADAARERQRLEARQRALEKEKRRRELQARITYVAWDGRAITQPHRAPSGARLKCHVCEERVTLEYVDGKRVFLHPEDKACDPAVVWVKAGMLSVFQQLKRDKRAVRIHRPCDNADATGCRNVITDALPDFNDVRPDEPCLLLVKDGVDIGQVAFSPRTPRTSAPHYWWLKPGKAVARPASWWQGRDGRLCPACEQRAQQERQHQDQREREQLERQRTLQLQARERHERRQREAELRAAELRAALEPEMLEVARRALAALAVDPLWAAERGVVVRHCENCVGLTAYVLTTGLDWIPPHAAAALVGMGGEIRCRCMHCGHPGANNHDRFRALGADLAGYVVRPAAIRSLVPPSGSRTP